MLQLHVSDQQYCSISALLRKKDTSDLHVSTGITELHISQMDNSKKKIIMMLHTFD